MKDKDKTKAKLIQELFELRQNYTDLEVSVYENNNNYKELAESITDPFFAMDEELKCTYWNRASEEFTGIPAKDALGKNLYDLFPEIEAMRNAEAVYLKALSTREPQRFINDLRIGDKQLSFVTFIYPNKSGISIFCKDMTEQRLAKIKLADAEKRYHSLFENVPISLWEEDFSAVKTYLDSLHRIGVVDLRDFFKNNPEAVAHCVEMVRVLDVNQSTLKLYQMESKEQLLRGLGQIFGEDAYNVFREELITLAEGHAHFESEAQVRPSTGDEKHVSLSLSLAPGYEDTWSRVLVSIGDITKLKRVEKELKSSREYLEKLNDSLEEVIFTVKMPERTIKYVNRSIQHIFGYEVEECIGKTTEFIYPSNIEFQSFGDKLINAMKGNGEPLHTEHLMKRRNGEIFTAEITVTLFKENGKITEVVGVVRDITERKYHEEQLRMYSHKLVQIQEVERRTIAHELHDQTGQSLTVINLLLDRALRSPPENVASSLKKAKTLVSELMEQVRDLSLSMHPSMLDDLGLLPTLLWYLNSLKTKTKAQIEFKHSGLNRFLPPQVKNAAYRIVQEALTNVLRHAGVYEATIAAWIDQDMLWIRIEDRGNGFEPHALLPSCCCGLCGMRERARSLSGELTVESSPGAGTVITAQLPISAVNGEK